MLFDVVGRLGSKNSVLDLGAHQCHLANTVERLCVHDGYEVMIRPVPK